MEVDFIPHTEAQLKEFAARKGKDAAQVVQETVVSMLERQARFVEGVKRGIASADRGDLIDHEEVVSRIDRLIKSLPASGGQPKPSASLRASLTKSTPRPSVTSPGRFLTASRT